MPKNKPPVPGATPEPKKAVEVSPPLPPVSVPPPAPLPTIAPGGGKVRR